RGEGDDGLQERDRPDRHRSTDSLRARVPDLVERRAEAGEEGRYEVEQQQDAEKGAPLRGRRGGDELEHRLSHLAGAATGEALDDVGEGLLRLVRAEQARGGRDEDEEHRRQREKGLEGERRGEQQRTRRHPAARRDGQGLPVALQQVVQNETSKTATTNSSSLAGLNQSAPKVKRPTIACASTPRCTSRPVSTTRVRWPTRPTRSQSKGVQPSSLQP